MKIVQNKQEQLLNQYDGLFDDAMSEALEYTQNPDKLLQEILLEQKRRDYTILNVPQPDQYTYRLLRYRGFVNFPQRLKNYIISNKQGFSQSRSHLPSILDVEPVSRCNYRCNMCVVRHWPNGKRADDMDWDNFKVFMEEQQHNLVEMKLQGIGEPMLHKRFFDMIRLVTERFIWTRTTLNGSLLNINENYRRLIDSGIGEIQTSFDGCTKEMYEEIRQGGNFENTVQNLTQLNDYANKKNRPYTRMWVLLQQKNRHGLFQFVDLAKKMGFRRLTFSLNLGDWANKKVRKSIDAMQASDLTEEEKQRLIEISKHEGIDISIWGWGEKYSVKSLETLCKVPFTRAFIGSDFRTVPCSAMGTPETADMGDALKFKETWNNDYYQEFRKAHLKGNIPVYCQNCYKEYGLSK